jgi:Ser/Thr protein kinase RdoA (MazF antagonist)
MAYALLTDYGRSHPLECIAYLLGSYCTVYPLLKEELDVLYTLICVRLCISISIGAYSLSQNPENEYLKLHSIPAISVPRYLISDGGGRASKVSEIFHKINQRALRLTAEGGLTDSKVFIELLRIDESEN